MLEKKKVGLVPDEIRRLRELDEIESTTAETEEPIGRDEL